MIPTRLQDRLAADSDLSIKIWHDGEVWRADFFDKNWDPQFSAGFARFRVAGFTPDEAITKLDAWIGKWEVAA